MRIFVYPSTGAADLNVMQIKYFVSAVEHGSITAAAEDQFISVQGVSQAIADLESEIGKPLLIRQNRGSIPTEFGSEFYERSRLFLHCHEDLELFVRNRAGGPPDSGGLSIYVCAPSYSSTERVGMRIASFIRRSFDTNATVNFGSRGTCMLALEEGNADAVITIGKAVERNYRCAVLDHVSCAIQMSKKNPLSSKKCIRLTELEDARLILWPCFDYFNSNVLELLARKHAPFKPVSVERPVKGVIGFLSDGGGMIIPHIGQLDSDFLNTRPVLIHPDEGLTVPLCIVAPMTGCAKEIATLIDWAREARRQPRRDGTSLVDSTLAETVQTIVPNGFASKDAVLPV